MLFRNTIVACAFACLATAAPKQQQQQQQPRALTYDDVIVPKPDGSYEIMSKSEWAHLEQRMERAIRSRALANKHKRAAALAGAPAPPSLARRDDDDDDDDCERSEQMQILTEEWFTNYDVAMSPVIGAQGGGATVAVAKGYQVANAVTVSVSATLGPLSELLSLAAGVDSSRTWTSTDTQTFTFTVTPGDYGVVVSNPYTRRLTGNYLSGCTDAPTVDAFVADSFEDQSFGELSWVRGPIYLCNSTTYPVPFCNGDGEHK